jgi:hypothetical protein
MTPEMAFECLLVSSDSKLVNILGRALEELSICTNICLNPSKASSRLKEASSELVVIDWEDARTAAEFLQEIWWSSKPRKPTVVAVSSLHRIPGAHLLLRRPVTPASGAISLKAAYFRMLQDHRLHTRYALMRPITATNQNKRALPVVIADIGDGGVGLRTRGEIAIGDVLSFHLLLPGTEREIYIQARVVWALEHGAAGCAFLRIPPVDVEILRNWLKYKSQIKKPLIVV